ncbi:MAG: hypothetical protein AAGA68_17125 [Pseudomonadota bacterium]
MNDITEWNFANAEMTVYAHAPSLDGARTAAIGSFACADAMAGEVALKVAVVRLREAGFGAVLGPMNGTTWSSYRLVTQSEGRDPFFLEPANPSHFVTAFENAGFDVVGRYCSAVRDSAAPAPDANRPPGIHLRSLRADALEDELSRIFDVCLQAFARNAFYTPIPRAAFIEGYRALAVHIDPELVLLAEDGTGALRGFLFALPDPSNPAHTVILKTYASLVPGCGSALANRFHRIAGRRGFSEVIHALMHEDNLSAEHSTRTAGRIFRRYALYGKSL